MTMVKCLFNDLMIIMHFMYSLMIFWRNSVSVTTHQTIRKRLNKDDHPSVSGMYAVCLFDSAAVCCILHLLNSGSAVGVIKRTQITFTFFFGYTIFCWTVTLLTCSRNILSHIPNVLLIAYLIKGSLCIFGKSSTSI